jgi:hypothetical protein
MIFRSTRAKSKHPGMPDQSFLILTTTILLFRRSGFVHLGWEETRAKEGTVGGARLTSETGSLSTTGITTPILCEGALRTRKKRNRGPLTLQSVLCGCKVKMLLIQMTKALDRPLLLDNGSSSIGIEPLIPPFIAVVVPLGRAFRFAGF